jgi:hypothetical protein
MSDQLQLQLAHMAYGGDYNPEQWPEYVWEEDVRLMQDHPPHIWRGRSILPRHAPRRSRYGRADRADLP